MKHNTRRLDLVKHSILLDYSDQLYRATAQCACEQQYQNIVWRVEGAFFLPTAQVLHPAAALPSLPTLFCSSDLDSFSYAFSQRTSDQHTAQLIAIHIA